MGPCYFGGMNEEALSRLHYELVRGLVEDGVCPSNSALAVRMGVEDVEGLLRGGSEIHGVVLRPRDWGAGVLRPLSLTPTLNWVEGEKENWWAPCVWCALGVAAVVGGRVKVHTRFGAEGEALVIEVVDGQVVGDDGIWVHFAIPPAKAWNNVHQHCSLVLPFHSPEEIADWCGRHGVAMGEPVPLRQVMDLARVWYGSHASPTWRKWSVAEAQEIFERVGLRSEFWRLQSREGKF